MEPKPIPGRAVEQKDVSPEAAAAITRNRQRVANTGINYPGNPSRSTEGAGDFSPRSDVLTMPS